MSTSHLAPEFKCLLQNKKAVSSPSWEEIGTLSFNYLQVICFEGLPRWLSGKEFTCQCRRMGSIPGSGRSHGGGNGNPLQYPCLKNLMDTGAWQAAGHRVTKSCTGLNMHASVLKPGKIILIIVSKLIKVTRKQWIYWLIGASFYKQ